MLEVLSGSAAGLFRQGSLYEQWIMLEAWLENPRGVIGLTVVYIELKGVRGASTVVYPDFEAVLAEVELAYKLLLFVALYPE